MRKPLQTFGQVEDVTAIFLAKSPYITGQVVNVDGGSHARINERSQKDESSSYYRLRCHLADWQ